MNNNETTSRQYKLYQLLISGRKYSVADITRALGYCDPRSHIAKMIRKGVAVQSQWITKPGGIRYKLYWIDPSRAHARYAHVHNARTRK